MLVVPDGVAALIRRSHLLITVIDRWSVVVL